MEDAKALDLVLRHMAGELTPEESMMLNSWLQNADNRKRYVDLSTRLLIENKEVVPYEPKEWEPLIENIVQSDKTGNQPARVRFFSRSWMRYAVAAVLCITLGAYLWITQKTAEQGTKEAVAVKTELLPGGNRAVLTLTDGSQIVLDSSADGSLTTQGNYQVVKLKNGQLAYEPIGNQANELPVGYNTISTPKGGQYQILLPDGSKVWLNAASWIKFPTAFTVGKRTVEIEGEAYLEIVKNAAAPFYVKTYGAEVQVLGTSFNINAYTDEPVLRTTLIDGAVKVIPAAMDGEPQENKGVILQPGHQAVAVRKENIQVRRVDPQESIAWKNNLFRFNDVDIESIMRQLARWYDLDVVYEEKLNARFIATIPRDVPASQVLNALQQTGDVHFKTVGNKIFVQP